MTDMIFGFLVILGIYLLGAWSGIFVMALIASGRDEDDFEDHLRDHTEDEDELP